MMQLPITGWTSSDIQLLAHLSLPSQLLAQLRAPALLRVLLSIFYGERDSDIWQTPFLNQIGFRLNFSPLIKRAAIPRINYLDHCSAVLAPTTGRSSACKNYAYQNLLTTPAA